MFGAWALQFEALCSCVMGEWHKGTFRHQSSVEGSTPLSVTAQDSGVKGACPISTEDRMWRHLYFSSSGSSKP